MEISIAIRSGRPQVSYFSMASFARAILSPGPISP